MIKQHYYQLLFFLGTILVVPLHAAHYNDSQKISSNQKSNYTPQESDNKVKPNALEKEKEDLEKTLKIKT